MRHLALLPFELILHRLARHAAFKAYEDYLLPGEKVLAIDIETGGAPDIWAAATTALYLIPEPSKENEEMGRVKPVRIPYEWISSVSEEQQGNRVVRELQLGPSAPLPGPLRSTCLGFCPNEVTAVVRRKVEELQSPSSEDPRFAAAWSRLAAATLAAHRGDFKKWRVWVDQLWSDEDWVPRILAGIMLELQLKREVGTDPTSEDISRLVRRIQEPYARFIGDETQSLSDIFNGLLGLESPEEAPGKAIVWQGTAALGILLEDPERQLALLRTDAASYLESVTEWCDEHWAEPDV